MTPRKATLASLKRDRVASRLLANFGFTHVQRSFDGVQYALDRPTLNVTLLAARPTQGVFQVDGWGELNISVLYGALTHPLGNTDGAAEWRLFGLAYTDRRNGIIKTDNRPVAAGQLDREHLNIGTFGGHYIRAVHGPHGTVDLLVWGALQLGSWGELAQRAHAYAAGYASGGAAAAVSYRNHHAASFGYLELLIRF